MAPPYDAISRRNLHDLESDLTLILQSPPPPPPPVIDIEAAVEAEGATPTIATSSLHDDIVRRFEFLKNLITLEEESLGGDKPEHLDHMKHRLAFLEDAYHQWLLFGPSSPSAPTTSPLDAASPCACTSSCFNEGDGDEWMDLCHDETPPAEEEPAEPTAVPRCVEGVSGSTEETRSWAAHGRKVCTLRGAVKLLAAAAAVAAGSLVLTGMWAVQDEQGFLLVPT